MDALRFDPNKTIPPPWWLSYVLDAEEWHIPPWELFDDWTPRAFWRECLHILRSARYQAGRAAEREQERELKNASA